MVCVYCVEFYELFKSNEVVNQMISGISTNVYQLCVFEHGPNNYNRWAWALEKILLIIDHRLDGVAFKYCRHIQTIFARIHIYFLKMKQPEFGYLYILCVFFDRLFAKQNCLLDIDT